MCVIANYDNSPANRSNPNPNAAVYYGDQTWEEMHFPSFGVVVDDLTLGQRQVLKNFGFGPPAPRSPAGH